MFGFRKAETAAKRADRMLDVALSHLIEAGETAALSAEHALTAVAHHEAALTYHHDAHAAALALHNEAKTVIEDVAKLAEPAVGAAAEGATEAFVKGVE